MNTANLLMNHKSIRKFKPDPISPELLQTILKSGQAAATSSFFQAYTVIRVTDQAKRASIAELAGNQRYIERCAEFFICCADLGRNYHLCSTGLEDEEPSYMEQLITGTVDVALMAQNMVIAAESEGLGICYIGGIRNNIKEVSELLNLPNYVYPVFGLCMGYPDHSPDVKPRLPLSTWVMENGYDATKGEKDLADYDEHIRDYYASRATNRKTGSWSEEIKENFVRKTRPHMKSFIEGQGLGLK